MGSSVFQPCPSRPLSFQPNGCHKEKGLPKRPPEDLLAFPGPAGQGDSPRRGAARRMRWEVADILELSPLLHVNSCPQALLFCVTGKVPARNWRCSQMYLQMPGGREIKKNTEHAPTQHTDTVLQNHTPETYIISFTKATPVNASFKKRPLSNFHRTTQARHKYRIHEIQEPVQLELFRVLCVRVTCDFVLGTMDSFSSG